MKTLLSMDVATSETCSNKSKVNKKEKSICDHIVSLANKKQSNLSRTDEQRKKLLSRVTGITSVLEKDEKLFLEHIFTIIPFNLCTPLFIRKNKHGNLNQGKITTQLTGFFAETPRTNLKEELLADLALLQENRITTTIHPFSDETFLLRLKA